MSTTDMAVEKERHQTPVGDPGLLTGNVLSSRASLPIIITWFDLNPFLLASLYSGLVLKRAFRAANLSFHFIFIYSVNS